MVDKSKTARARDYIEDRFQQRVKATKQDFIARNPDVSQGTYDDAWHKVAKGYEGDPAYAAWAEESRPGWNSPTKADRVKAYLEERLAINHPVRRGECLEKNPDISKDVFDKTLNRWVEKKRHGHDPQFGKWDENVRRALNQVACVRRYLKDKYRTRARIDLEEFRRENPGIKEEQVEVAAREYKADHEEDPQFTKWWGENQDEFAALKAKTQVGDTPEQTILQENPTTPTSNEPSKGHQLTLFEVAKRPQPKPVPQKAGGSDPPAINGEPKAGGEMEGEKHAALGGDVSQEITGKIHSRNQEKTITSTPELVIMKEYKEISNSLSEIHQKRVKDENACGILRVGNQKRSHQFSKTQRVQDYVAESYKKNEIISFVDFSSKNPEISRGTYYGTLKSLREANINDTDFSDWLESCTNAEKQEEDPYDPTRWRKKFGKSMEVISFEFHERQYQKKDSINFAAFLAEYPMAKSSSFNRGRKRFRSIHASEPDVIQWLDDSVKVQDKIARIKKYLSGSFPNRERLDWQAFLNKNPDISPRTITEGRLMWLAEQTTHHAEVEKWLQDNWKLDRASALGLFVEKIVIATIYPVLKQRGIVWYYQTKNFGRPQKSRRQVEGRLLAQDLRDASGSIGSELRNFLATCGREEIAVDITISSDLGFKIRKYADKQTALLIVTVNGQPQQQPLENHIRVITIEEFIGPKWLNLDPTTINAIKKIIADQREAIRQCVESPAFQQLKELARQKWAEVKDEITGQASHQQYVARLITLIETAIKQGHVTPQLRNYLDVLRARGHQAAGDFLEGVARDRARRKVEKSDANEESSSQSPQEGGVKEQQEFPRQAAATQPDASITPENDAGQQDREEARSGSTDTPAETWARCAAMFPDRRRLRQQQALEEELAWEAYGRQVAAQGEAGNPIQRDLTSIRVALSPAPVPSLMLEPATIHEQKIAPKPAAQSNPPINDPPEEGHGVPTPEDMTVAPPAAESPSDSEDESSDEKVQGSEEAESESDTEGGEGTTEQECDKPPTEEPRESREEVTQTPEKAIQPAIEVTSDGGTLMFEGGPGDPKVPDGGNNRQEGDGKRGEDRNGVNANGETIIPDAGKHNSGTQRTDATAMPTPGDGKLQVNGEDLQSIKNAAAYKEGALVLDQHGKGVLLSAADTKSIREALDHVQTALKNARDDVCGPDPTTRVRPDGSDATGDAKRGTPMTGDDVKAIRDARTYGGGVLIHSDKGGLFLNEKDVKEINETLDRVRAGIDKARPEDARQTVDGPVVNGQDLKNANPPKDPYPIHDPQVAEGQVKIKPDDLRDIKAAGSGEVAGEVVIKTDTRPKMIPREIAERINNACDRLGAVLNRVEWKLANGDRGDRPSSRTQVDRPSPERGQEHGHENSYENPRYPATPDARQQSTPPIPDKPNTTGQSPAGERPQGSGDHLTTENGTKDHDPNAIPTQDISHEEEKPAARERGKVPVGPAEGDLCGYVTRKDGRLGAEGQKINLAPFEWQTDPPRAPSDRGREPPAPTQPPDKPAPGGDSPRREEPDGDEINLPKPDPTPDNQGQDNSSGTLPKDEETEFPESGHDPDPYVPEEGKEDEWAGWNPESGQESGADNSEGGEDRDQDIPEEDDDDEWAGWNPESGHETGDEAKDHVDDGEGAENRGENQNDECIDRGERGSLL